MMGVTSAAMASMVETLANPPIAFGANCGVGASDLMRTVLGFASTGTERPLIAKGNAGIPKYHDGHIHYDGTPELMAEYAVLARDAGVRIIGGCCGTMPEHLRAMREALETRPKGPRPVAGGYLGASWRVLFGLGRDGRYLGRSKARTSRAAGLTKSLSKDFDKSLAQGIWVLRPRVVHNRDSWSPALAGGVNRSVRNAGRPAPSPSLLRARSARLWIRSAQRPCPRHPWCRTPDHSHARRAIRAPGPSPGRRGRGRWPPASPGTALPLPAAGAAGWSWPRGAGVAPGLHHRLKLVIGQRRDQRRDLDAHGDARLRQTPDHLQAGGRGEGARGSILRARPASSVVTADRDGGQPLRRHRGDQVDVAFDRGAACGDPDRVAEGLQHRQHLSRMIACSRSTG